MAKWTGILELDIENKNGKSVPENVYFHRAFKVQRPIYHTPETPCYYILNPGGGYLDGDTYRIRVSLREQASLTLTTQAATKIYKTPQSQAFQQTEIKLAKGSYLEYLPDPIIAYQNARYFQKNVVRMEEGATFLYSDIITPGWAPEGELFSYNMVRLISEIYLEGQLIALDHLKLAPDEDHITGMGFLEGYTHLGAFIVIGEKNDDPLIDRLYETISKKTGDFSFGISPFSVPGFSVRIMANSTQLIEQIIGVCRRIISREWYDTTPSFLRKY